MYEEPKGPIETLEEDLEKTIKHWWMFLILGILCLNLFNLRSCLYFCHHV